MNLAWQRAKTLWESQNPGSSFDILLSRYITQGGMVWSCPEQFLLACPVVVHSDESLTHDAELGDTWFIHLAALATNAPAPSEMLSAFVRLAPRPLPWVAWHRPPSKRLHRHAWERVVAHLPTVPHRSLPRHEYLR